MPGSRGLVRARSASALRDGAGQIVEPFTGRVEAAELDGLGETHVELSRPEHSAPL